MPCAAYLATLPFGSHNNTCFAVALHAIDVLRQARAGAVNLN